VNGRNCNSCQVFAGDFFYYTVSDCTNIEPGAVLNDDTLTGYIGIFSDLRKIYDTIDSVIYGQCGFASPTSNGKSSSTGHNHNNWLLIASMIWALA